MSTCKIKVNGLIECFINKRRSWSGVTSYEISFPVEVSLRSLYKNTSTEVYQWLDEQYGVAMWYAE